MNLTPRISIITPSLNQRYFLEETIKSVLNQNYPNLEYFVIDGGSTDGTLELLVRYSDKIKWISERDNGQSDAINKGLAMATGEIIGIINSDDLYEDGVFFKIGDYFQRFPEILWLTGKCRIINEEGEEVRRFITAYKNYWLRLKLKNSLYILNYISQPATFLRKKLVDQIGMFSETLHYAMDYDYWLRACEKTEIFILNDYLAQFRIYSSSKSGHSFLNQFSEKLSVLKNHTSSIWALKLHTFHSWLITTIYKRLKL